MLKHCNLVKPATNLGMRFDASFESRSSRLFIVRWVIKKYEKWWQLDYMHIIIWGRFNCRIDGTLSCQINFIWWMKPEERCNLLMSAYYSFNFSFSLSPSFTHFAPIVRYSLSSSSSLNKTQFIWFHWTMLYEWTNISIYPTTNKQTNKSYERTQNDFRFHGPT